MTHPFLDVCMYALPHILRDTSAEKGSIVKMTITGEAGGDWWVHFNGSRWERINPEENTLPATEIIIDEDAS